MTMIDPRPWWESVSGSNLSQGDLIHDCQIPVFAGAANQGDEATEEDIKTADLIIVTQSCDLENNKVDFVALCLIHTLSAFEAENPAYRNKGRWELVRKGREEGLHLLASPDDPGNNLSAYVVDFGHIISLPFDYLSNHAASLNNRWRLKSPFLEHFSQAFARFFMRVGLPSAIPKYK